MTGEQISILPITYSGTVLCTETYNEIKSGTIYLITDGEITGSIFVDGGGGGDGAATNTSEKISDLEQNVAIGAPLALLYKFITLAIGKGTTKLLVSGVLKSSRIIGQGEDEFDVTRYK